MPLKHKLLSALAGMLACHGSILVRSRGQTVEIFDPAKRGSAAALCFPSEYWGLASKICAENAVNSDFQDVDVYSKIRGVPILSARNFCSRAPSKFELWRDSAIALFRRDGARNAFGNPDLFAEPTPASFLFRQTIERSGTASGDFSPGAKLKPVWYREPLNVGIHGASKASPAVDESGVYVGGDSSWFYAYDLDGKLRWKFYFDRAQQGIHSTAALDHDHVYVGAYNGVLYCLNKSDGRLVWSAQLGQAIGSSPVLFEDSVYVAAENWKPVYDGAVVRVDRKTGALIWRSAYLGAQSHSSPAIDSAGRRLFLGANNGRFFALDLATGKSLWTYNDGDFIRSTPIVLPRFGAVYFSSYSDFVALDLASGKPLWKSDIGGKSQSSPTYDPVSDSFVLATHAPGAIVSVARADGKLRWKFERPGSLLLGSATLARNAWISCSQNELCELRPSDGKILARVRLPGALTGAPTIFGGAIYVSIDEGGLLKLAQ